MFDKLRLFVARALFAVTVAMALGFGLMIAGIAAILGLFMILALRIAMIGSGRSQADRAKSEDSTAVPVEPDVAAQPA